MLLLRRLALLGLIGLAAILVLLAGPRMMAGFDLAAAQDTVRRIRTAEEVTVGGLNEAIQTRRDAVRWDPGPRSQAELGEMLLTLAALDHPLGADLRPMLTEESLAATRGALAKSPTQPFAWTRYAQALALKTELDRIAAATAAADTADGAASPRVPDAADGGVATEAGGAVAPPVAEAAAAGATPVEGPLGMAIVTAPWQVSLVPTRVEMGLFFWSRLSDFTRRLVAGQIFIAARIAPERLAEVTRRQNALREVMAILLADNELLMEFTRTYYYTQSIDAQRAAEEAEAGQQ